MSSLKRARDPDRSGDEQYQEHIEVFQEHHNVCLLQAHHYDEPDLMEDVYNDVVQLETIISGLAQPTLKEFETIDACSFITAKSIVNDYVVHGRVFRPVETPLESSRATDSSIGLGEVPERGAPFSMQIMTMNPIYDKKSNGGIMLHGRTKDEKTACVVVRGFYTRCYLRYNNAKLTNASLKWIKNRLESTLGYIYSTIINDCSRFKCGCNLRNKNRGPQYNSFMHCSSAAKKNTKKIFRSVKIVQKTTALGYEKSTSSFIELVFKHDYVMQLFKSWFNKRKFNPSLWKNADDHPFFTEGELFEADVSLVDRFMNDKSIKGACIVDIDTLDSQPIEYAYGIQSRCDYAFSIMEDSIIPVKDTMEIYPIRLLSYDIETTCAESGDEFSNSDRDSVIQISAHYSSCYNGVWTDLDAIVYTIGSTNSIKGGDTLDLYNVTGRVRSFDREEQMILAFWQDRIAMSPDIVTGYNDGAFDMPYLTRRSLILGLSFFPYLSKVRNKKSEGFKFQVKKNKRSFDRFDNITVGVIHWDLCQYLMKFVPDLDGYSLDAVSNLWLSGAKEHIRYADIPKYQKTVEGRTKLASYCLLDSVLVSNIIKKQQFLLELISSSRTLVTTFNDLLSRGLNHKITNYLRWIMNHVGMVIPSFYEVLPTFQKKWPDWDPEWDNEKIARVPLFEKYKIPIVWDYKGAFVLDPVVKLHTELTLVLDFKSLYPAEQRYYNISSDTYIINEDHLKSTGLTLDDVYEIKIDDDDGNHIRTHFFVKENIKRGVMAIIQDNLADERNRIKKMMKNYTSTDPMYAVLNSQQLGIKLIMNSLYGVEGSKFAALPVRAIAEAITACGRKHLIESRDWILERWKGKCIYGDTDSVFLQIDEIKTIEDAFRVGAEIEDMINDLKKGGLFDSDKAMYLEFEKVLESLLLLAKKAYVSMKYEWDHKLQKATSKLSASGVKTKRRDNAKIIKDLMNDVFISIVEKKQPEIVVDLIRNRLQKLLENKLPLEDLVTSSKLSNWTPSVKQAHVAVAKKMRSRGQEVALGDRIFYYITQGQRKSGISELAESLDYGKQHGIPGNSEYYIDAVVKAVSHIGDIVFSEDAEMLTRFKQALNIDTYTRVVAGVGPMSKFFKQTVTYGPKVSHNVVEPEMKQTRLCFSK